MGKSNSRHWTQWLFGVVGVWGLVISSVGIGMAECQGAELAVGQTFGSQISDPGIRHAFLITGGVTAIVSEDSRIEWLVNRNSRDGFVLPSGNVLVTHAEEVIEYDRAGKHVFRYPLSSENKEISTAQRLDNGDTLVAEMGAKPRLLIVSPAGEVRQQVALQPETDNTHMQTRMARRTADGNFLVPHLLAFAVKEYRPDGSIVRTLTTDRPELGGRAAEAWPFTAIDVGNGRLLVNLTHSNQSIVLDAAGQIVWKLDNDDVAGRLSDPCGAQCLPNGHTFICSYGQQADDRPKAFEVNEQKEVVWEYVNPALHGFHEVHVISTNGQPTPWPPRK
ncbi:MAG: hypothetical protein U0795_11285 [Pirellulales bacterium]